MKRLLFALLILMPALSQAQWINQSPFRYSYKGVWADTTLRVPVINSNRAFFADRDSVGRLFFRPDSVKLFGHFPGNVIKSLVTYDSLVSLKNWAFTGFIQNQNVAAQSADFAVSGVGSSARFTSFNSTSAAFTRYFTIAHSGIDTLQQVWSIGLQGTQTGGPTPNGDSLKIRYYNNVGAAPNDVLTITRTGTFNIPGLITVGLVNNISQRLQVNGGVKITATTQVVGTLRNDAGRSETKTTTVTGDYTALSTDLYINVNNSANCTITLPLAGTGSLYHIKKISANGFTVTVVPGSGTLDGISNYVMTGNNEAKTFHDDLSNWFIY